MPIVSYLILAHLIGDYPLQPLKLVKYKYQSWRGVATHVGIHFIVTSALLYLYFFNLNAILIALMLAAFHYVIDQTKAITEKSETNFLLSYWLDQLCHFTSIGIVTLLSINLGLSPDQEMLSAAQNLLLLNWYYQPFLIYFFALIIFTVYAIEYSRYQLLRKKMDFPHFHFNQKAVAKRLFIISLFYIALVTIATTL